MNKLTVAVLLAVLVGCNSPGPTPAATLPGESLEWDKIASRDFSSDYKKVIPTVRIAATLEQVSEFEELLLLPHLESVYNTGFNTYLVVAVFQGEKGSTGYSVEVVGVRLDDNVITIYAEFLTPGPEVAPGQAITSPYYVLRIRKTPALRGDFAFVLDANGKEIMRQSHFIP